MPAAWYYINMHKLANLSASNAAKLLLGQTLIRTLGGQKISVKIVETEAYHQADPASHTYSGQTERNHVMFGPAGLAYVYFTYGMHYCLNVVVGRQGYGAAVLIRAVEPISGVELMQENRSGKTGVNLCNGPAKLTQALSVDKTLNSHDLSKPPLQLQIGVPLPSSQIDSARRIGISKAVEELARFYIKGNLYVSTA